MNYLLDTNVISEITKTKPNFAVQNFLQDAASETMFMSVLTIGEIKKGIVRLNKNASKQKELLLWFENEFLLHFKDRFLAITPAVAECWGNLVGRSANPVPTIDSLIAATAAVHNLILVTRNIEDFRRYNIELMNPWD